MLLNRIMPSTVVSASREIAVPADKIFELIADPSQQPRWDGNDNLAEADTGQRMRAVGDVFTMTLTMGVLRDNHVVEFDEGRLIAWRPSEQGKEPPVTCGDGSSNRSWLLSRSEFCAARTVLAAGGGCCPVDRHASSWWWAWR